MDNVKKAERAIKRRRDQLAFDKLSKEEQQRRTRAGLNPYESEQTRAARRKAEKERRKKHFDSQPKEIRDKLTALGVSPYQEDVIIRRACGTLKAM